VPAPRAVIAVSPRASEAAAALGVHQVAVPLRAPRLPRNHHTWRSEKKQERRQSPQQHRLHW
jgi:hypothetical protein